MGRENPFSPWCDSCEPHEECDLVWRRWPCWVGCCVPKPGLVIYTLIICRLKYTDSDFCMNIYRPIFPLWFIVYCHACICSNTVLCACKILLALTRWAWAQGDIGCTKKALRACSAGNVYMLESEYAGSSNQRMLQRLSQTLLPSLSKQLGWGKYLSLLLSIHTSLQTSPAQRLFYQGNPVMLKVSSVGNSWVRWPWEQLAGPLCLKPYWDSEGDWSV